MREIVGYRGICSNRGVYVPVEDAFAYAMEHLPAESEEDKRGFIEWFFSGDFLPVREGDLEAEEQEEDWT